MDEDLIEYCEKLKQKYSILNSEQREFIKKTVRAKYVRKDAKTNFSFFDMLDYSNMSGINIPDAWRWIKDIVANEEIIVFINEGAAKEYIKLYHGGIFVDFYDESPLVEFYITDCAVSFLLGYNHSQCLFAFGTAGDWLENDNRYKRYQKIKRQKAKKE